MRINDIVTVTGPYTTMLKDKDLNFTYSDVNGLTFKVIGIDKPMATVVSEHGLITSITLSVLRKLKKG